jgi:sec-independent protein translocase protein TatB
MPEAVRTVGLWIGRIKRSLRETRSEIERQIGVDDIRRQLHNEEIMQSLENARRDMDKIVAQTQESLNVIEHNYSSEPDLPYHSHMDEAALEKAIPLITPDTENTTEQLPDSAKVTTLADNKTDQTPLDKKASL